VQQPGYLRLVVLLIIIVRLASAGSHRFWTHGFSLDIKPEEDLYPFLTSDGLTLVFVLLSSSAKCYSWNHDTVQFHSVDFDDHMYSHGSEYSSDGKLFACWSRDDSHVQVWDTQTGQLVCKFQTFSVYEISPALTEDTQTWCLYEMLAYYVCHAGLRIRDIADLTADHWHSRK